MTSSKAPKTKTVETSVTKSDLVAAQGGWSAPDTTRLWVECPAHYDAAKITAADIVHDSQIRTVPHPAAAALGRMGRGEAKRRGTSAHYRRLAAQRRPATERYVHAVRYGDRVAYLRTAPDLRSDLESPRSYAAMVDGRQVRVVIDHEATGTATTGTGDTVVRSVPRGWRSGRA